MAVKKGTPRNAGSTKLKDIRVKRGFTQIEVAANANVNPRTYQMYEQGYRLIENAGLDVILPVCNVLRCRIEDIIDSDDLLKLYSEYAKRTAD